MTVSRRTLIAATRAATLAAPALLRAHPHGHLAGQFKRLNPPGRVGPSELPAQQAVSDSPAPRAAVQGQCRAQAPLPIPRTEMARIALGGGVKCAINESFSLAWARRGLVGEPCN